MKHIVIYPSTDAEPVFRGGHAKSKTLICEFSIGKYADKAHVMKLIETKTDMTDLIAKVKRHQLDSFRSRMPEGRKGVEVEIGGIKYVAAIRRLTPSECDKLQGVPRWYNWDGISETQHYRQDGNGWQCDTIKHCWSFLPKFDRPIRVWSLFDGMSCASIVLRELGIPVEVFVSSEIDKHALVAEKSNFPDMIQVGSVTDINVPELVEKYGVPDFLCGGSPCQSFSFSGKMKGMSTVQGEEVYTLDRYLELKAQGFAFEGQSYLFWEYMRILTELKRYNPNIYFFLENVEMLDKWERVLSHAIGVRGVHINSALVSAQQRKRIYWSNIRVKQVPQLSLFSDPNDPFELPSIQTDIPQPADRGITIKDILQDEAEGKYYLSEDTVKKIMDKTEKRKLQDYLIEPQASVDEILDYMMTDPMFAQMSDRERRVQAERAYSVEKARLKKIYG